MPVAVLRLLVRRQSAAALPRAASSVLSTLTGRQLEILEHAVLGFSRAEIADELGLSVHTVRTHLQHTVRFIEAVIATERHAAAIFAGTRLVGDKLVRQQRDRMLGFGHLDRMRRHVR